MINIKVSKYNATFRIAQEISSKLKKFKQNEFEKALSASLTNCNLFSFRSFFLYNQYLKNFDLKKCFNKEAFKKISN